MLSMEKIFNRLTSIFNLQYHFLVTTELKSYYCRRPNENTSDVTCKYYNLYVNES